MAGGYETFLSYVDPDEELTSWSEETRDPLPVITTDADGVSLVLGITLGQVDSAEVAAFLALTYDITLGGRENFRPTEKARDLLRKAADLAELDLDHLPQVV